MSFSTDVKEELSKLSNLANKECVKAEMYGYLNSNNTSEENGSIKFTTESEYNINRFSKLLNNINITKYDIDIVGKNFSITVPKKETESLKKIYSEYKIENIENIEKAFVRGAFLGSGSINNPKNKYHIEVTLKDRNVADVMIEILQKYDINFKVLNNSTRKTKNKLTEMREKEVNEVTTRKCSIYSKDGEEISKFLAFIEASSSVIKFEEIRVYRDMRNNINRIVNCETANLSKTVDASIKQIEAINKIKESGRFSNLPDNLKEIAELRIKNPDASLIELGKMLENPIGKSGVSYRLHTLVKISKEI